MCDGDDIRLSDASLQALLEFYSDTSSDHNNLNYNVLKEDWELSQFWYDGCTTDLLANAALDVAGTTGKVACVSCPTVFSRLYQMQPKGVEYYLFEYDRRFQEKFAEQFIFYDYNDPLSLDEKFRSYFDLVLADPPYLSEECLENTSKTIKFLAKSKIVLCTGAIMEESVRKFLNLSPCQFKPQHQNNLGNKFKCFVNWNFDDTCNKQRK